MLSSTPCSEGPLQFIVLQNRMKWRVTLQQEIVNILFVIGEFKIQFTLRRLKSTPTSNSVCFRFRWKAFFEADG